MVPKDLWLRLHVDLRETIGGVKDTVLARCGLQAHDPTLSSSFYADAVAASALAGNSAIGVGSPPIAAPHLPKAFVARSPRPAPLAAAAGTPSDALSLQDEVQLSMSPSGKYKLGKGRAFAKESLAASILGGDPGQGGPGALGAVGLGLNLPGGPGLATHQLPSPITPSTAARPKITPSLSSPSFPLAALSAPGYDSPIPPIPPYGGGGAGQAKPPRIARARASLSSLSNVAGKLAQARPPAPAVPAMPGPIVGFSLSTTTSPAAGSGSSSLFSQSTSPPKVTGGAAVEPDTTPTQTQLRAPVTQSGLTRAYSEMNTLRIARLSPRAEVDEQADPAIASPMSSELTPMSATAAAVPDTGNGSALSGMPALLSPVIDVPKSSPAHEAAGATIPTSEREALNFTLASSLQDDEALTSSIGALRRGSESAVPGRVHGFHVDNNGGNADGCSGDTGLGSVSSSLPVNGCLPAAMAKVGAGEFANDGSAVSATPSKAASSAQQSAESHLRARRRIQPRDPLDSDFDFDIEVESDESEGGTGSSVPNEEDVEEGLGATTGVQTASKASRTPVRFLTTADGERLWGTQLEEALERETRTREMETSSSGAEQMAGEGTSTTDGERRRSGTITGPAAASHLAAAAALRPLSIPDTSSSIDDVPGCVTATNASDDGDASVRIAERARTFTSGGSGSTTSLLHDTSLSSGSSGKLPFRRGPSSTSLAAGLGEVAGGSEVSLLSAGEGGSAHSGPRSGVSGGGSAKARGKARVASEWQENVRLAGINADEISVWRAPTSPLARHYCVYSFANGHLMEDWRTVAAFRLRPFDLLEIQHAAPSERVCLPRGPVPRSSSVAATSGARVMPETRDDRYAEAYSEGWYYVHKPGSGGSKAQKAGLGVWKLRWVVVRGWRLSVYRRKPPQGTAGEAIASWHLSTIKWIATERADGATNPPLPFTSPLAADSLTVAFSASASTDDFSGPHSLALRCVTAFDHEQLYRVLTRAHYRSGLERVDPAGALAIDGWRRAAVLRATIAGRGGTVQPGKAGRNGGRNALARRRIRPRGAPRAYDDADLWDSDSAFEDVLPRALGSETGPLSGVGEAGSGGLGIGAMARHAAAASGESASTTRKRVPTGASVETFAQGSLSPTVVPLPSTPPGTMKGRVTATGTDSLALNPSLVSADRSPASVLSTRPPNLSGHGHPSGSEAGSPSPRSISGDSRSRAFSFTRDRSSSGLARATAPSAAFRLGSAERSTTGTPLTPTGGLGEPIVIMGATPSPSSSIFDSRSSTTTNNNSPRPGSAGRSRAYTVASGSAASSPRGMGATPSHGRGGMMDSPTTNADGRPGRTMSPPPVPASNSLLRSLRQAGSRASPSRGVQ